MEDQQLGCLIMGETLMSVAYSGFVNYLDRTHPERPLRILKVLDTVL